MGSGFAVDSFVRNTGKGQKAIFRTRILCGACNGSGTQVEDSYLDNMILYYERGTMSDNVVSDDEIPHIISIEINAINRDHEERSRYNVSDC